MSINTISTAINKLIAYFYILSALTMFMGCNREGESEAAASANPDILKGERFRGGILRLNAQESVGWFYPPSFQTGKAHTVAAQIFEGLFSLDEQGGLIPQLAERYNYDARYNRYTIVLKKGVYFHDDAVFPDGKGRELTAKDVIYVLQRLCIAQKENKNADYFIYSIKGARAYYNRSRTKNPLELIPGLKALGRYQLRITLEKPDPFFLDKLTLPAAYIYPREMIEKYGVKNRTNSIGTGPFQLKYVSEDRMMVLERFEKYYQKDEFENALPYLSGISFQFIKDKKTEILEFIKGNQDFINRLTNDNAVRILKQHTATGKGEIKDLTLCSVPEAKTTILAVMPNRSILKSPNFRKALNFGIHRDRMIQSALNNDAINTMNKGIIPPSYSFPYQDSVYGFSFHVDSIYHYLSLSGYQSAAEKPIILSYPASREELKAITVQLADDWLSMGIKVETEALETDDWEQKRANGSYELLLMQQAGYFPYEFLYPYYSKRKEGMVKPAGRPFYYSREFNSLYEQVFETTNRQSAYKKLALAEQKLLDDAPFILLWHEGRQALYRSYIRNLPCHQLLTPSFKKVYFQKAINI